MGEAMLIEREVGIDAEHWSRLVQMAAELFLTVRREDAEAISWADIEALTTDDMQACFAVEEPRKAPSDRKPRKQTAAQRSAAMKASSDPLGAGAASAARRTPRGGRRAAAGSTRSGEPSTSGT
jgi:hypothetical protein